MSESITHTAVLDDCLRLMLAADEVCPAFCEAARRHRDFARLGVVTRAGDRHTVRLLKSFGERWAARRPEHLLEAKLAFVLGWLCHRAADRQMKPVYREVELGREMKPTECSVYQDAFLFREIYASGPDSPYHPRFFEPGLASFPAARGLEIGAVEELCQALLQRSLVSLHTLIPDDQDAEGWLEHLFKLRQEFRVDVRRYAEAIARPDLQKLRRFIVETRFYDPQEPLIAAARALQHGQALPAAKVRDGLRGEPATHYGKALKTGCGYLLAASELFSGKLSEEAANQRLEIGKPGRDGRNV